ncbi:MAG: DUF305 domain-containing protein [Alphaproteobacteria bacterium]
MKPLKTSSLAPLFAGPASLARAQGMDHSNMGGMSMGGMSMGAEAVGASGLPDVCLENAGHMANMGDMHNDMMAEDFDVAFICGMIPHHQGELDLASAALEYAEDEWVKELALEIGDTQERAIFEMRDWLELR